MIVEKFEYSDKKIDDIRWEGNPRKPAVDTATNLVILVIDSRCEYFDGGMCVAQVHAAAIILCWYIP